MGKDDVRTALQAIDDEAVRDRVAAGDFSDLNDVDLDADEAALMQAAAGDYPDVAGYAFGSFEVAGAEAFAHKKATKKKNVKMGSLDGAYAQAMDYTL